MEGEKREVGRISMKIFYSMAFWVGVVFLITSYMVQSLRVFIMSMVLLTLSLFIYNLGHKKPKKRLFDYVFYTVVSALVLLLLYLSQEHIRKIIQYPFSSRLLYILYALILIFIINTISGYIKRKPRLHMPKEQKKTKIEKKVTVKKLAKLRIERKGLSPKTRKSLRALALPFFVVLLVAMLVLLVLHLIIPYKYLKSLVYALILIVVLTFILVIAYVLLHRTSRRQIRKETLGIPEKQKGPLKGSNVEIKQKDSFKEEDETKQRAGETVFERYQEERMGIKPVEVEIEGVQTVGFETDFDKLYHLVEKKGRIKISAVAEHLGVNKKTIEEWARILEDHGLLKVHYPAIGGPELIRIGK